MTNDSRPAAAPLQDDREELARMSILRRMVPGVSHPERSFLAVGIIGEYREEVEARARAEQQAEIDRLRARLVEAAALLREFVAWFVPGSTAPVSPLLFKAEQVLAEQSQHPQEERNGADRAPGTGGRP